MATGLSCNFVSCHLDIGNDAGQGLGSPDPEAGHTEGWTQQPEAHEKQDHFRSTKRKLSPVWGYLLLLRSQGPGPESRGGKGAQAYKA